MDAIHYKAHLGMPPRTPVPLPLPLPLLLPLLPPPPQVKKGAMSQAAADAALGRVSGALDYAGFARADMVIEAVIEDIPLKQKIFAGEREGRNKGGGGRAWDAEGQYQSRIGGQETEERRRLHVAGAPGSSVGSCEATRAHALTHDDCQLLGPRS